MGSLKTFIRSVRNAKTLAAERAVIRKESAKLRSSFRDPHLDNDKRRKNIQKLLYLYIIGEPTYFGQVECLKLIASPRFTDKRVGYLAAMLILDESQDIITLLTNSLDLDMQSSNQYVVGLALTTLGNITTAELAKDLYSNVEHLMQSPNTYVKKKAVMVASKLVNKDPMLAELYLPYIHSLLEEKDHAVLMGTTSLINAIYANDPSSHIELRKLIPKIVVKIQIVATDFSPEYDINGIPDLFLICALLRNVRVILQECTELDNVEQLNDVLTSICARFENFTNAGFSIIYECVKTIFSIKLDSSLKVLGINILSKFLARKSNNIRYVALDTLLKVIDYEPLAVQRHRVMIVACLRDGDVSIRRRALELTFGIMNQQNIKLLTKELLQYLESETDEELKEYITFQLSLAFERFNSDLEFITSSIVDMLKLAGNSCNEIVISSTLATIMKVSSMELIKRTLVKLFNTAKSNTYEQYGLTLITVWCLGEYYDLATSEILESDVVQALEMILTVNTYAAEQQKVQMKLYALTTCLKLSVKFQNSSNISKLETIIKRMDQDISLEIQSRAIEYLKIFNNPKSIRKGLLERMPAPVYKKHENVALLNRSNNVKNDIGVGSEQTSKDTNDLLDLLGDGLGQSKNVTKETSKPTIDLLSDIFGSTSIDVKPTVNEPDSVEAYNDDVIKIGIIERKIGNGIAEFEAIIKNVSKINTILGITLLCAVPKTQKLQLSAISKTTLSSNEFTLLNMNISGPEGAKIKIRFKLSYTVDGSKVDKQFDYVHANKM